MFAKNMSLNMSSAKKITKKEKGSCKISAEEALHSADMIAGGASQEMLTL